jgi:hypothetical protein
MKLSIATCTTVGEMRELLLAHPQLLHIRHAEVIQRLCDIGLSHDLAKKTWLYFVQNELPTMEESLNTQLTLDIPDVSWGHQNGK